MAIMFKKKENSPINDLLDTLAIESDNYKSDKRVDELYNEITSDNYESFIKESFNIAKKAPIELDILKSTISRYDYMTRDYFKRKTKYGFEVITTENIRVHGYSYAYLSNLEYEMIIRELYDIKNELIIRREALNKFVEKEMKTCKKIDKLTSAKEILDALVLKVSASILNATIIIKDKNPLKDKQALLPIIDNKLDKNNNETYIEVAKRLESELTLLTEYHLPRELRLYLYKELEKIMYNIEGKHYRKEYYHDIYEGQELTKKEIKARFKYSTDASNRNDWGWITYHVSVEDMKRIYKIVADCYHKRELYRIEHFNDYEKYIESMNEVIDKYSSCLPTQWDMDEFNEKFEEFTRNVGDYLKFYVGGHKFNHEKVQSDEDLNVVYNKYYFLTLIYASVYGDEKLDWKMRKLSEDCEFALPHHKTYDYHYYIMEWLISEVEKNIMLFLKWSLAKIKKLKIYIIRYIGRIIVQEIVHHNQMII